MLNPLFCPYLGGTEKHVFEIGRRLAKRHNIVVLTSHLEGTPLYEEIDGMKVYRTPCIYLNTLPPPLPPPYTISPTFIRELMKQKADIFHIHNRFWYYAGTLLAIKMKKKKLVLTLHNAKTEGISPMTDRLGALYDFAWGQRIMEACDKIVAVSDYTRAVTVPARLQYKSATVYNGVNTTLFSPKDPSEIKKRLGISSEPVILFVGRLLEQKGVEYLIRAFGMLKKDVPDARLVIIGRGPLELHLRKVAGEVGVADSLRIINRVPEHELPLYYNMASVFMLPSLWEPLGIVVLEAMACGIPVVSSDTGGPRELVTPDCGFLARPKDPADIYAKLKLLLQDEGLRKRMGTAARRRAVENFTWDIAAQKMEKIYESLMEPAL